MFDSTLEALTVNCNGVVSTGVLSYAWQDGCGPRSVLVNNFLLSGFKFLNGWSGGNTGGADCCPFSDVEIFGDDDGSGSSGAIGIDLTTPVGSAAAFKVAFSDNCVITGGLQVLAQAIWSVGNSTTGRVHIESSTHGYYLDTIGFHTIEDSDGSGSGLGVTNYITLASTFTGSLVGINPRRNLATNLINDLRSGGLGTVTGYDVPLIVQGSVFPPIMAGGCWSAGSFTVSGGTITVQGLFNCTVSRTSAGIFVVTEARARPSTLSCVPFAQSNQQVAVTPLQIAAQHTGAASYTINTGIGGTATDPTGEVNFFNLRLQ
jgi:hypothetical protein